MVRYRFGRVSFPETRSKISIKYQYHNGLCHKSTFQWLRVRQLGPTQYPEYDLQFVVPPTILRNQPRQNKRRRSAKYLPGRVCDALSWLTHRSIRNWPGQAPDDTQRVPCTSRPASTGIRFDSRPALGTCCSSDNSGSPDNKNNNSMRICWLLNNYLIILIRGYTWDFVSFRTYWSALVWRR